MTFDGKAMCSKLFSLVQIFVHPHPIQKIELLTNPIIETYKLSVKSAIGLLSLKPPKNGEKKEI